MIRRSFVVLPFLPLLAMACSAEATGESVSGAEALAGATSLHVVPVVSPDDESPPSLLGTTLGFDGTADAAKAALPAKLAGWTSALVDSCAAALGVARAQVFARFDDGSAPVTPGVVGPLPWAAVDDLGGYQTADGCRIDVTQETFNRGTTDWDLPTLCPAEWCATVDLAGLPIVKLDAKAIAAGAIGGAGGAPIVRGGKAIVALHLDDAAAFVSNGTTKATVAHVFVRFDGGAFAEWPGLPVLPNVAGARFDDAGLGNVSGVLDVPASADRVEMYVRFERWTATFTGQHDSPDQVHLLERAPDGFVSHFGANFVAPVVAPAAAK